MFWCRIFFSWIKDLDLSLDRNVFCWNLFHSFLNDKNLGIFLFEASSLFGLNAQRLTEFQNPGNINRYFHMGIKTQSNYHKNLEYQIYFLIPLPWLNHANQFGLMRFKRQKKIPQTPKIRLSERKFWAPKAIVYN